MAAGPAQGLQRRNVAIIAFLVGIRRASPRGVPHTLRREARELVAARTLVDARRGGAAPAPVIGLAAALRTEINEHQMADDDAYEKDDDAYDVAGFSAHGDPRRAGHDGRRRPGGGGRRLEAVVGRGVRGVEGARSDAAGRNVREDVA